MYEEKERIKNSVKIKRNNAFIIKTPIVRRGIMGWKLSKINDKGSSTSHNRLARKGKKQRSAFRNVTDEILSNPGLGHPLEIGNKLSRKKKSTKVHDRSLIKDDLQESRMLAEKNNQIINLKAPNQFETNYNESIDDYNKSDKLENRKTSLNNSKSSFGRTPKYRLNNKRSTK